MERTGAALLKRICPTCRRPAIRESWPLRDRIARHIGNRQELSDFISFRGHMARHKGIGSARKGGSVAKLLGWKRGRVWDYLSTAWGITNTDLLNSHYLVS